MSGHTPTLADEKAAQVNGIELLAVLAGAILLLAFTIMAVEVVTVRLDEMGNGIDESMLDWSH